MSTDATPVEAAHPVARVARRMPIPSDAGLLVGVAVLVLMLVLAFLLPVVTGNSPDDFAGKPYTSPSPGHPFGTDQFGRDVMVRTFAAAKVDYLIAFLAVAVSLVIGTTVGVLIAVLHGGVLDWILSRVVDAVIAFPLVILVLALVVAIGVDRSAPGLPAGTPALLIALFTFGWAFYARLAHAQALSLREREFVVAAQMMGYSQTRIIVRHMLPNVLSTATAYAVGDAVFIIGATASLAFLGAGVQPPTPEWGQIMFEARGVLKTAWWTSVFPGVALVVTGLALALIADGLIGRLEGRSR
jgi:peptide/nickel transport system permease protein